jgi:hypothetical protein
VFHSSHARAVKFIDLIPAVNLRLSCHSVLSTESQAGPLVS